MFLLKFQSPKTLPLINFWRGGVSKIRGSNSNTLLTLGASLQFLSLFQSTALHMIGKLKISNRQTTNSFGWLKFLFFDREYQKLCCCSSSFKVFFYCLYVHSLILLRSLTYLRSFWCDLLGKEVLILTLILNMTFDANSSAHTNTQNHQRHVKSSSRR